MLYFPQLQTGATGQYPMVRKRTIRTVENTGIDGHSLKLGDPGGGFTLWELHYLGLTDAEWRAIADLFEAAEGRLRSFTFLDPAGNLLTYSDDLTAAAWEADALLSLTPAVPDPYGTSRATRVTNTAQIPQRIQQYREIPANFHYCFSVYARSGQAVTVRLERSSDSRWDSTAREVTPNWRRLVSSGNLGATEVGVSFGVELEPGATVELFGFQLEPQPAASKYRATKSRSGVYRNARFAEDNLRLITEGPQSTATVVRIASMWRD